MLSFVALFLLSTILIVGSVPLAPGLHDAGQISTFLEGPLKIASQHGGFAPEGLSSNFVSKVGHSPHLHGALAPGSFPLAGLSDAGQLLAFLEETLKIASQIAGSNLGFAPEGLSPNFVSKIGHSPHVHGAFGPKSFPSAGLSDAEAFALSPRAFAPNHHHALLNHGVNHHSNLALAPAQHANEGHDFIR